MGVRTSRTWLLSDYSSPDWWVLGLLGPGYCLITQVLKGGILGLLGPGYCLITQVLKGGILGLLGPGYCLITQVLKECCSILNVCRCVTYLGDAPWLPPTSSRQGARWQRERHGSRHYFLCVITRSNTRPYKLSLHPSIYNPPPPPPDRLPPPFQLVQLWVTEIPHVTQPIGYIWHKSAIYSLATLCWVTLACVDFRIIMDHVAEIGWLGARSFSLEFHSLLGHLRSTDPRFGVPAGTTLIYRLKEYERPKIRSLATIKAR